MPNLEAGSNREAPSSVSDRWLSSDFEVLPGGVDDLILVVGLPRSGTTWIGKIFDSHPDTLYLHEPESAAPMIKEIPLIVPIPHVDLHTFDLSRLIGTINRTLSSRKTRVAAHFPRFPKSYRRPALDRAHRGLAVACKAWSRYFGELSLPDLAMTSPPRPIRTIWKSIQSLGRVGLLARLMPKARIIHVIRHSGGQIASVERGRRSGRFQWDGDTGWLIRRLSDTPLGQERGLNWDSFKTMRPIEARSWIWALFNDIALESIRGLTNTITIRYEDICADPLGRARALFDFAQLEWHDQVEAFINRSTTNHRDDFYSVYRDPLIAATRWRDDMESDDVTRMLAIVGKSTAGQLYLDQEILPVDPLSLPTRQHRPIR